MSKKSIKRLKNSTIYFSLVFMIRLLRIMDRKTGMKILRSLAGLGFKLAKKEREKTIRHLTWAFGDKKSNEEIIEMARDVWLHFGMMVVDVLRMPNILNEGINNYITSTSGIDNLEKAYAKNKGVILLTGHFGSWELLGAWMVQNGFPLKVVGKSSYDPRLDEIIVGNRNSAGYTNIARGKGTREIIRALRQGSGLGMLIDQDTKVDGVFVNFFDRPAHTATGPVTLSEKLGAPVMSIFMYMKPDFTYHVECGQELELDFNDPIETNVQKCSDEYEKIIKRFPTQWVWMHERWKKQPK